MGKINLSLQDLEILQLSSSQKLVFLMGISGKSHIYLMVFLKYSENLVHIKDKE